MRFHEQVGVRAQTLPPKSPTISISSSARTLHPGQGMRFGFTIVACCWFTLGCSLLSDLEEKGESRPTPEPLTAATAAGTQAAASIGTAQGPASSAEHVIQLRFHLLRAPGSKWLHVSRMKQVDIEKLVAGVNEVWKPANVRFEVEKVLTENAIDAQAHDKAVNDFLKQKRQQKRGGGKAGKKNKRNWSTQLKQAKREQSQARTKALPQGQRISKGIDIFVVGRLPSAGGVFGCPLRAVLFSERRKGTADGLNIAKVLAHELGHALGLSHTPCANDENLMMEGGCRHRKPGNVALNATQIQTARNVAKTGEARQCRRGEESVSD